MLTHPVSIIVRSYLLYHSDSDPGKRPPRPILVPRSPLPQYSGGTHSTGKTGEMAKRNSLSGKTQGIWKFCQHTWNTQGIWFAHVINSLILKVKDILIFAAKISTFGGELDKSAKSVMCM